MLTKDLNDGEGGGGRDLDLDYVAGARGIFAGRWGAQARDPLSDRYLALNPPGPGGQPNPLICSFILITLLRFKKNCEKQEAPP